MVRLNRIYTRTGDAGTTGLVDGSRVSKADPIPVAMGDVDEANACVGLAIPHVVPEFATALGLVQNELFDLGADLATPPGIDGALRIVPAQAARLEAAIDALNADLAPLTSFVLPAGGNGAAELHLARTVVRRAERSMVAAGSGVSAPALAYINRLSDYLFVAARWVNRKRGEVLWQPGATR